MNQIIMNLLLYFMEVTIISSVFCLLYFLLFSRKTFYKINRLVLLSIVFISIVLPLLNIDVTSKNNLVLNIPSQKQELVKLTKEVLTEPVAKIANQNQVITTNISKETPAERAEALSIPWLSIIFSVYYLVGGFLLFRLILGIRKIIKMKSAGKNSVFDKTEVIITSHPSSFSFFNWIFIGQSKIDSPEFQTILTHELQHARNFHSVDVMLFELLKCMFWFNPFFYLLANQSKLNNEYFTDKVLSLCLGIDQYTDALMSAFNTNQENEDLVLEKTLINNFAFLSLKFRIMQLLKQPSGRNARLSYTLIIPVLVMLFLAFSCNLNDDLLRSSDVKTVVAYYEDEFGDQQILNGKLALEYEFEGGHLANQSDYGSVLPGTTTLSRLLPFVLAKEELRMIEYGKKWPEVFDDNNMNRLLSDMERMDEASKITNEISHDGYQRLFVRDTITGSTFGTSWEKIQLNESGLWSHKSVKWTNFYSYDDELARKTLHKVFYNESQQIDKNDKLEQERRWEKLQQDLYKLMAVREKSFEYDSFGRLVKSTGNYYVQKFNYSEEGELRKIVTLKDDIVLRWFEIFYSENNEINKVSAYNGNNDIEYSVLYEYTYY